MKLKSYLKRNESLINKFGVLYIHTNKLHCNGTEDTMEDLHRIFDDYTNIHRVIRSCWDLQLSEEELNCEVIDVPLAHVCALPFHHGIRVLNIVIKKEEDK